MPRMSPQQQPAPAQQPTDTSPTSATNLTRSAPATQPSQEDPSLDHDFTSDGVAEACNKLSSSSACLGPLNAALIKAGKGVVASASSKQLSWHHRRARSGQALSVAAEPPAVGMDLDRGEASAGPDVLHGDSQVPTIPNLGAGIPNRRHLLIFLSRPPTCV